MKFVWRVALPLLVAATPSLAQYYGYDSSWNATGPKPLACIFDGVAYYPADEICVRKGFKQVCGRDGVFAPAVPDATCTGPTVGERTYSVRAEKGETLCERDRIKFGVGAEICVAPGSKQICKDDGSLSAPQPEAACTAAVRASNE